jgi:hypothetical protein
LNPPTTVFRPKGELHIDVFPKNKVIAQGKGWSAHVSESIQQSMTELWTKVAGFIPNLVGTILILIVGYIVSKLLQRTATAILRRLHFDKASEKTGLNDTFKKVGIRRTASEIVGAVVFWLYMLMFFISAADALGLDNVSRTIDSFVIYLPNVVETPSRPPPAHQSRPPLSSLSQSEVMFS